MATHELGGIHLIRDMKCIYTTKDLYDMLETLDVHDTLKKIAFDKAKAEAKQNNK